MQSITSNLSASTSRKRTHSKVTQTPTDDWIEERQNHIQKLLKRKIERMAIPLRNLLEPIELESVLPEHKDSPTNLVAEMQKIPDWRDKSFKVGSVSLKFFLTIH